MDEELEVAIGDPLDVKDETEDVVEAFEVIADGQAFHVESSLSTSCKVNWQDIGKIKDVQVKIPKLKIGEKLSLFTRKISCDSIDCKMMFANKRSLKKHTKNVHKEKPHQCSQCLKKFSFKNLLSRHIEIVHKKVKPYQCSQCLKYFNNKNHLSRHIDVVHKRIRPCQCSQCSKNFSNKHHLRLHMMKVHNFDKPHPCVEQNCDEKFVELRDLKDHLRRAHGAAKLVCGIENCAATFTHQNTLFHHKRKHHLDK